MRNREAANQGTGQPRSGVDLYVDDGVLSHWVALVVAEKAIDGARVRPIVSGAPNDELDTLNPERTLPTLADREIVLHPARLIVDYLDERYPHPPLMPVEPLARARLRLILGRMESRVFPALNSVSHGEARSRRSAHKALRQELLALSPIFPARGHLLGEAYNLVDCAWSALGWQLDRHGVATDGVGHLQTYLRRLHARPAFNRSVAALGLPAAVGA